jgi:predicted nuclease of restriction endonuclease-like (RecB) superfamily
MYRLAAYFDTEMLSQLIKTQFYKRNEWYDETNAKKKPGTISENNLTKVMKHHFVDSHSIDSPLSAGHWKGFICHW